jgi:hypothetical protein
MLQNTHLSALGKLIGRLASNRDPSWFTWVLKLTMDYLFEPLETSHHP